MRIISIIYTLRRICPEILTRIPLLGKPTLQMFFHLITGMVTCKTYCLNRYILSHSLNLYFNFPEPTAIRLAPWFLLFVQKYSAWQAQKQNSFWLCRMQPIFARQGKDSANECRKQIYLVLSRMQPILSKDSANERRNKTRFSYAECSLSSHVRAKIVQAQYQKFYLNNCLTHTFLRHYTIIIAYLPRNRASFKIIFSEIQVPLFFHYLFFASLKQTK